MTEIEEKCENCVYLRETEGVRWCSEWFEFLGDNESSCSSWEEK